MGTLPTAPLQVSLLLLFLRCTATSTLDNFFPHQRAGSPWFEGWYTRVVGDDVTFAVGMGSFPDQTLSSPSAACFVLLQPKERYGSSWRTSSFLDNVSLKVNRIAPSFSWLGTSLSANCSLVYREGKLVAVAHMQNTSAVVEGMAAARTPWDVRHDSPEGWLQWLGALLPLHWYVYSLRTPVAYSVHAVGSTVVGHGYAHFEKNWGNGFPPDWIWAQGHNSGGPNGKVLC